MKVAYVVCNERPTSGLMRTQVIGIVKEFAQRNPGVRVCLVALWQPWVMFRFRRELKVLRAELAKAGIRLIDLPLALIPNRHFAYSAVLFPILRAWTRVALWLALLPRYDVAHCRGYLASYGAVKCSAMHGHRVVFDMRSFWPGEHVTIGAWRKTDRIHALWEQLELTTVRSASATLGVTKAMVAGIHAIHAAANAVYMPICVDVERVRFDPDMRSRRRAELGWKSGPIIVYQGSLGLLGSNLREVAEYVAAIARALSQVRFLVLTPDQGVDVKGILTSFGVPLDRIAVRHPGAGELAGWMSAADAGIHAMSPGPDSPTRLGVKVVEYWACALPVIVNPNVGAAAALITEHGVGAVLESTDSRDISAVVGQLLERNPVPMDRARSLAEWEFSLQSCAVRYAALYRDIGAGVDGHSHA